MARERTPQEQEAQRNVAPNVVGRRRPYRIRGTPQITLPDNTETQDRFFSRRVAEATDERQEYEGLLKSTISNRLRDLNNKSLEKVMVSKGVTAQKEWGRAQEHRQEELDSLVADFDSNERQLIAPMVESSTVDFQGAGSRHVAKEMQAVGIMEYQKDLAGDQDDSIRKSATYLSDGRTKSLFYTKMQDFYNNKGETFDTSARLAKMKGLGLNAIKEQNKGLITDTVVKSIEYNLGNGNYANAKAIFDDMKKYIDPEVHDELQKKLEVGEELEQEDRSLKMVNDAWAVSNKDIKKMHALLREWIGDDAGLNKKVQQQLNIFESRMKIDREINKAELQSRMFDVIQNNYKAQVPWTNTARQIHALSDQGNSNDPRTFSQSDLSSMLSFAHKINQNKLDKTDHVKFGDLMYESVNAPTKFAGRNLKDPSVVKGLDYETIQYLQRQQDRITARQGKAPPAFMWEPIKDRIDDIVEFLPEEQRFDFMTENYENIQDLIKDGKFDANAMKGLMRKFDEFDATSKPWWWNRMADAVPGFETQAMQEYRSQLKDKDFSYYPNIELLKKFEGIETAARIMMHMNQRHIKKQTDANIRRPQPLTNKQLNEILSTYITKKGYRK